MKKNIIIFVALLTSAVLNAQDTVISEFPWENGFESQDDFSRWSTLDLNASTSDNWTRYSSYAHTGNYCVRSSYNSSGNSDEWLISPALQLPNDAYGFMLKWWVRGSTYSGNQAHYTVLVSTSGTDTADFTDTLFAEAYPTSTYVERGVSLEDYAGQTIRIAFIHDSYNDNGLCLDDIAVRCTLAPVVSLSGPTQASEGDTLRFAAHLTEGDSASTTYSWSSTMQAAGYADLMPYDDSLMVVYTGGGTDTITLVAANNYGTDTATTIVRVCGSIVMFPWEEGFESAQGLTCWTLLDLNASTSDNWTRYSSNYNSHSGNYSMRSSYNTSGNNNEWLVTPPLLLPDDAEGFVVKWWVKGSTYSSYEAHYTVLLSTSGSDTADFTDTLFAESYGTSTYIDRSVSLEDYAGQSIRIAFIHDSHDDNGLYLDDISVYSAMPPTASIAGPASAVQGEDVVFHAVVSEGSTASVSYDWSSSMEIAGMATLLADGDSVTITYLATGTDTLRLIVDNGYGSDTAYAVIHVCGTISELPWTEDFNESSALSCWTVLDFDNNTGDNWTRSSAGGLNGSGSAYSSYNASANANDWLVSPSIELPSPADNHLLSWQVKGSSYMGSTAHYTVLVFPASNLSALQPYDSTLFEADTLFAEAYGGALTLRQASLAAYAGQTVRFAFIHDSYDDDGLTLDDITVRSADLPVVALHGPATAFTGETVSFSASLTEGSTDGLTFTWANTLGGTLTPNGDSLTIVYTTGGTDTVTVIASNASGADTATAVVVVADCPAIATFPWEEGFEDVTTLDCWAMFDLDGNTNDNWSRNSTANNVHSGSNAIRSYYNSSSPANDWLVTPSIAIPANAEGLSLTWWVKGTSYSSNISHYTVLLSASGLDTASFADTLFAEAYSGDYANRAVSLEDYAGQNVRIAFVHDSYNDNGLYLDDIAVRAILLPMVSIDGPASAFTGTPAAFAATLAEGSTDGLAYTWSNTLAGSTLTPNGDSLGILYTLGGTDTVVVTATNVHGSSTDTLIVQVIDCPAVSTFPWNEGFEGGADALQCWSVIDNNSFAADNWLLVDDYSLAYEGSRCIGAPYRENGSNDDYIVSPAIALPADASNLYLSYYVSGGEYYGNVTTYQTLVSTTGTAPADFTDVLLSESYSGEYVRRSVSLAPYGGQTIHFAFRHTSYDADNLLIDNIAIDTNGATTPVGCPAPEVTSVAESETSITVAWTGTAFAYEVAIVSGNWTAPASGTSVLTTTYTFSSLNPSTSYTVGIRSLCTDGSHSDWTTTQVTTASTSCQAPTDLESNNVGFCSATLSWYTEGNETSWEVDIRSAQPAFDTLIVAHATSVDVDGLAPGCTYTFKVRALCSAASHSPWSAAATFTTAACDAPTGLAASAVTHNSATITWTANGAAAYEVSYGIGTSAAQGALLAATTNSLSLTQLEPNTTYSVYVRSHCTDGITSNWSPRVTFTTADTATQGIDSGTTPSVSVSPNPASDRVLVQADGLQRVEMVDASGRSVATLYGNQAVTLDVSRLDTGVYFLRLLCNDRTLVRKLVITR